MLHYPNIDPVLLTIPMHALTIGIIDKFQIRWYPIAYIVSIISVFWLMYRTQKKNNILNKAELESAMSYSTFGIIIGGRIFYILCYQPTYYFSHISEIVMVWHGGMSFHGGCVGAILGLLIAAKKNKGSFFNLTDTAAIFAPIGLFMGRIANFINAELFGRQTSIWLGMIFPTDTTHTLRHPSQLYEACLEGVLLFCIMIFFYKKTSAFKFYGMLSSVFLIGYSIARFICEFFREPDENLGLFFNYFSMGQILCLITAIFSFVVMQYSIKHRR